jgi:hypothetical protein
VADHEPRVEVVVDRERTERGLAERAHEHEGGEHLHPAAQPGRQPGRDREHERRDHGEERNDAVRELDVRVVALLRQRIAGLAAGPVLAAEARAGQPNGRTRRDDEHEGDGRDDRDAPESLR